MFVCRDTFTQRERASRHTLIARQTVSRDGYGNTHGWARKTVKKSLSVIHSQYPLWPYNQGRQQSQFEMGEMMGVNW